jgi:hypothetical protein
MSSSIGNLVIVAWTSIAASEFQRGVLFGERRYLCAAACLLTALFIFQGTAQA